MDEDGNHVLSGGFWGHCEQDCNEEIFGQNAELSISPPSQGKKVLLNNVSENLQIQQNLL